MDTIVAFILGCGVCVCVCMCVCVRVCVHAHYNAKIGWTLGRTCT